ncbi:MULTISPECIES: hypothetical protein [Pectobacterium]|uniref:Uncharacterized protein n=1 Tax=Pectobacterium punjabense TaxID=2108399 RepID=A0ABX6KYU4_9GAMM|nr:MULTISPECIES: hypothetical protein [Pectobacterium]GKW12527.1 hypothetical protein PEC301899_28090 [Pectobacterium carotovorum subsp. carotovorum]MBN3136132.1 hypothetical protein [Pectobacterium punjabense]MBS4429931.1 hypothetical protein [Pectobacterium punjabense]MCE5378799.1 hypothetical protein [Pectobacterium punjabense]MCE9733690.1 hypothetical protein [Pectobacterium sp. IFB5596]
MQTIPVTVFSISTFIGDLVTYPNNDDIAVPNPIIQDVLNLLDIDVNLCTLCDHYFDDVVCGQGDIWVYRSASLSDTYFIVDFHVGMTEQLDIAPFYIKSVDPFAIGKIRPLLRHFFDQLQYQVSYEESCGLTKVDTIIETPPGSTYCVIKENGYEQQVVFKN